MSKVVHIATHSEDGRAWSPTQMLEEAIKEIAEGKRVCTKALVITLDDSGDGYRTGFLQSGLNCSQMVALVDIFKQRIFNEMR